MPKFSHIRLLKCKDGRYRKGIIVTFSEEEKNIGFFTKTGPQEPIVQSAFNDVERLLHGGYCDTFTTVEYGPDVNIPREASFTVATLRIVKWGTGLHMNRCIKYSIKMK